MRGVHEVKAVGGVGISPTFAKMGQIVSRSPWAIRCNVFETLLKPSESIFIKSIAILSSEQFEIQNYLKLSVDSIPVIEIVNIVGYSGVKSLNKLTKKQKKSDESKRVSKRMLPTLRLIVVCGIVTDNDDLTSYNISTCPGLSVSSVLHNGKVYDIILYPLF